MYHTHCGNLTIQILGNATANLETSMFMQNCNSLTNQPYIQITKELQRSWSIPICLSNNVPYTYLLLDTSRPTIRHEQPLNLHKINVNTLCYSQIEAQWKGLPFYDINTVSFGIHTQLDSIWIFTTTITIGLPICWCLIHIQHYLSIKIANDSTCPLTWHSEWECQSHW